jgi:hypothetical protein
MQPPQSELEATDTGLVRKRSIPLRILYSLIVGAIFGLPPYAIYSRPGFDPHGFVNGLAALLAAPGALLLIRTPYRVGGVYFFYSWGGAALPSDGICLANFVVYGGITYFVLRLLDPRTPYPRA